MRDGCDDRGRQNHCKRSSLRDVLLETEEDSERGNEHYPAAETESGGDEAGSQADDDECDDRHDITIRTAARITTSANPRVRI